MLEPVATHTHTRLVRFSFVAYIVLMINIYMALFLLHTVYDTCRHMQQTQVDYDSYKTYNVSNHTHVHIFSFNNKYHNTFKTGTGFIQADANGNSSKQ